MRYIVQKIPARSVAHLSAVFPELVVIEDTVRDPMGTFIRSMESAGQEPHVHFEDDIELCADFRSKLTAAISQHPNQMISFFTLKNITEITVAPGSRFACFSVYIFQPA